MYIYFFGEAFKDVNTTYVSYFNHIDVFHLKFWTRKLVLFICKCKPTQDLAHFFHGYVSTVFPLALILKRASCQLLTKALALKAGKLPTGGLPRNSVVK